MNQLAQATQSIPPISFLLSAAIVLFLGIGIHEFAHAKVADMAGDPTPRSFGRVTLNLFKHFELMGTIFMIIMLMTGFGIGWGKPVPMNPSKMSNPRWDHFAATAAGPLSNILQAMVYAAILRISIASGLLVAGGAELVIFLLLGVTINVTLFCFNLLPFGLLDGMWLVGSLMPEKWRNSWVRFNLTVGSFVFLAVILLGQASGNSVFGFILGPMTRGIVRVLTGTDIPLY